jgi:hypothetical protein
MASIFENYFKNSLVGRGLSYLQDQQQKQQFGFVNEDGFIDAPRPSPSTGPKSAAAATAGDRAANDPLYGKGESSVNQAIFGPTKAEVESFLKENPVYDRRREDYDPALADIQRLKDRKARAQDPNRLVGFASNTWTYLDQQRLEELEAAYGGGEEKKDEPTDKLEEISQKTFDRGTGTAGTGTAAGAQAEYTKAKAESVGEAEDEAIEMIKKGRRATILTKPGGLLGTGEEEGQTRRRRALIGR